jgi:hypothetical protein
VARIVEGKVRDYDHGDDITARVVRGKSRQGAYGQRWGVAEWDTREPLLLPSRPHAADFPSALPVHSGTPIHITAPREISSNAGGRDYAVAFEVADRR